MKILFLSQYFHPEPTAGATRVSELTRIWADLGHEITVIAAFPNHPMGVIPESYRKHLIRRENYGGVNVIRTWVIPMTTGSSFHRAANYCSFPVSAALFARRAARDADVIIATSPPLFTGLAGLSFARSRGTKFVLEVRDFWVDAGNDLGLVRNRHVLNALRQIENYLYRTADMLITVTEPMGDALRDHPEVRTSVRVVSNGVDTTSFQPGPKLNAVREKYGLGDKFVVSYIGTHSVPQGLDSVLDAARLLKDTTKVHFLFVGAGSEKPHLVERARSGNLSNVLFLDPVPRNKVAAYYQASDVSLVVLRRAELFRMFLPSKLFEIMACGVPLIASVEGETARLVEKANAGIVAPPDDPEALANVIREVAERPEQLHQWGTNGRAFVERHYDRRNLAETYLSYLQGLLEESASPTRSKEG